MKWLHIVAFILLVIGGINWGLVGLLDFNAVTTLVGDGTIYEMLVYALVGVAAVYIAVTHAGTCKVCAAK